MDSGSTSVVTTGVDAACNVNKHIVIGAVENGAPHDTGHDIRIAHGNNDNRKVDDTDTRGAPETMRCHVEQGLQYHPQHCWNPRGPQQQCGV